MKKLICFFISTLFILSGCFHKSPEGTILVLTDDFTVGKPIPLILDAPEEFDDLHMEMWFCTLENGDESIAKLEYIQEQDSLESNYTQAEIEELFINSPMDIYRDDYAMETLYSPRIVLFTPMESGTYTIGVSGYYKSTSPSDITNLEVVIHE